MSVMPDLLTATLPLWLTFNRKNTVFLLSSSTSAEGSAGGVWLEVRLGFFSPLGVSLRLGLSLMDIEAWIFDRLCTPGSWKLQHKNSKPPTSVWVFRLNMYQISSCFLFIDALQKCSVFKLTILWFKKWLWQLHIIGDEGDMGFGVC